MQTFLERQVDKVTADCGCHACKVVIPEIVKLVEDGIKTPPPVALSVGGAEYVATHPSKFHQLLDDLRYALYGIKA